MLERLLERGKTSGREDDNTESIKKRFGMLRSDVPKAVSPE
jgi:UMP-CMP kinase